MKHFKLLTAAILVVGHCSYATSSTAGGSSNFFGDRSASAGRMHSKRLHESSFFGGKRMHMNKRVHERSHTGRMHGVDSSQLLAEAREAAARRRQDRDSSGPSLQRRASFSNLEEFRTGNSSAADQWDHNTGRMVKTKPDMSDVKHAGESSKIMLVELSSAREYIKELESQLKARESAYTRELESDMEKLKGENVQLRQELMEAYDSVG